MPRFSPLHQRVLRIHHEPCTFVSDAAVHAALTARPAEYLAYVSTSLRRVALGRLAVELPAKQVFTDSRGGDFRVMPCVTRDARSTVKTVKVVGTNFAQRVVRDQITVGKVLVLHPSENFVTHIVDACVLSSARTGVCAALAVKLLARRRARLTIVGAGRVGFYSGLYAAAAGVQRIAVWDSKRERADACVRALRAHLPRAEVSRAQLGPGHRADVVVLATTSRAPVCRPPAWGADLIVSLGADTDRQSELDRAWAQCTDIYVDAADTLRFGDLKAWIKSGLLKERQVVELVDAARRRIALGNDHPRLFVSTGSALFDNVTISYLLHVRPVIGQARRRNPRT